jgi:hypothetical protein
MKRIKVFSFLIGAAMLGVTATISPMFLTSCSYTLPVSLQLEVGKDESNPCPLYLTSSNANYQGTIASFVSIENEDPSVAVKAEDFKIAIIRDGGQTTKRLTISNLTTNSSDPTKGDVTISANTNNITPYLGLHALSIH